MNSLAENVFNTRPVCILELPLNDDIRVLHPEQVILKIGTDYRDVGAFCYALRSGRPRKAGQPTEVVLSSFLKQRPAQILQAIKSLSAMLAGNRLSTISSTAEYFRYPLFVSPNYLPWGLRRCGNTESKRFWAHQLNFSSASSDIKAHLLPTITTEDIAELEDVDPFRAWSEEEEFGIGKP